LDIVKKSGTWFSYNDEKLGQGREKARDTLKENPPLLKKIETEVRDKIAAIRAARMAPPVAVEEPTLDEAAEAMLDEDDKN
jgi:recombination protein RecA